jgi:purine-nucleoside phosphorylase
MSIHISAKPSDIAQTILLPGDPLRAKFVAENFLDKPACYNEVRGMYGYTGIYKGKKVSVQGTGMGLPSLSIYVNELIDTYGCKNLIRIGSCGSFQPQVKLRDIILAQSASTDSNMNRLSFQGMDYAPSADFSLLMMAYESAKKLGIEPKVGNILSSDIFYHDDPDNWKLWAKYQVLAVEMETSALYTLAAKKGVRALSLLTVSDSLVTKEATSSIERQTTFNQMVEVALGLLNKLD